MNTISSIQILKKETEQGLTRLSAEISDNGDLIINDYCIGPFAQEMYGHDDVEADVKVKKDFKDTLLLLLLKERFDKFSEIREWLKSNGVPYKFDSWP